MPGGGGGGNKGFGEILNVNFVQKKIDPPREDYTNFPLLTRKFCFLPGKKVKKGRNFCLHEQ